MSAARAELCVVGSANLDLVATTARLPRPGETVLGDSFAEYPGGKGLNQAVAAARTGRRRRCAHASATTMQDVSCERSHVRPASGTITSAWWAACRLGAP